MSKADAEWVWSSKDSPLAMFVWCPDNVTFGDPADGKLGKTFPWTFGGKYVL